MAYVAMNAEGNFQGAVNTAKMIAEAAQRKQMQQQKQEQLYEEVADRAVALIEHAQPVSEQNKYLQAKQVESYGLLAVPGPSPEFEAMGIYIGNTYSETKALREKHAAMDDKDQYKVFMTKNDIMIPVSDQKGKVWTVQTIAENGFKSWLKGGKKHGNFFILGQPENGKPILEAEGSWRHTPFRNMKKESGALSARSWRHTPFRNVFKIPDI